MSSPRRYETEEELHCTKKWFCKKCNQIYNQGYKECHLHSLKHNNNDIKLRIINEIPKGENIYLKKSNLI